jgi:Tfp pilus assembly protein PilV
MAAQKYPRSPSRIENCEGFVLLEVLVAMSLILGVWTASIGVYQRLALYLTQQEAHRSDLRKEFDAFEVQEHARSSQLFSQQGLSRDPARVPSRHRSVRNATQSSVKK